MRRFIKALLKFSEETKSDHMGAFAAQSAFFILLSLFPLFNIVLTIIKFLPISEKDFVELIGKIMPDGNDGIIAELVGEIYNNSAGSITILSLIIGIWSAARGILAIRSGLNEVYKAREKRNYIIQRLISSLYTIVIILAIIATSFISVFGEQVVKMINKKFPAAIKVTTFILSIKSAFILAAMFLVFLVMYVVLPSRKIKLRQQLAGAMFAAIWWMLMSKLFNWYVDSYVAKTFTYGSLTMAILLMFWLYFGVLAIFIGGQINVFLERTDNLKTIIKNDGSSPQFLEIQPERKFNIHKKNKKNKKSADNSNGKESDDDKSDDEETVSKKSADEKKLRSEKIVADEKDKKDIEDEKADVDKV